MLGVEDAAQLGIAEGMRVCSESRRASLERRHVAHVLRALDARQERLLIEPRHARVMRSQWM
jgi:hypothetical protein